MLWVHSGAHNRPIAVETCAAGAGDVGIQVGILGLPPTAVIVAGGTSYRHHQCPKAAQKTALSFTGRAPAGKRR